MTNRIREFRERANLSQVELAELCNTSQPQIDRLEKDERRLTVDWLQRLAKPLKCQPVELVGTALLEQPQLTMLHLFGRLSEQQRHALLGIGDMIDEDTLNKVMIEGKPVPAVGRAIMEIRPDGAIPDDIKVDLDYLARLFHQGPSAYPAALAICRRLVSILEDCTRPAQG
jgi:transcriptional regulator with XRE-family HTH domain